MQQTGMFCKELTPTKAEHLMNRARKELNKLEEVIKSKKQRAEISSLEQEQSDSKAKVNVSSLVKAKKNEICVPEEHGLEINKVKEKKKKHKSKSKDYSCEKSELNNTLSLGLRVNIELANENDMPLSPKQIKTILMKHGNQGSPLRLKEKTEKVKSDEIKKQKVVKQANNKSVSKTYQKLVTKESPEKIAGNQENSEKNKIDLTLSATVIKTDKRKKLKAICATKHKKKKSRRESASLEEPICTEETESSQYKKHKNDRNYDSSTFQLEERKKKARKKEHADSLLEIETECKSKRKKKKHKDIQSEDVDQQSEKRKHKNSKTDEEESYMDSSDTIKKKKKKAVENTENLEDSYNGVDCNESVTIRKHKHQWSRDIESVNESLTSDSSHIHKKKKKKHKDAKESDISLEASYGELKNNTEETSITETDSYYTSESSSKRKHTKHKTGAFEQEVQDTEVHSKKKKKEKVTEISDGCTVNKQKKKRHRKDSEEFTELIELQKKSKKRKSTEEEEEGVIHSVLELTESKRMKEDELIGLGSKSTKHKKKRRKEYKDVENTDYSSENIQEINSNESVSLVGQSKKVKKKKRRLGESDAMQNALLEGEHQIENTPDVDSVLIDKSNEQLGRHSEESIVTASDPENGQMKKKKKKKKKNKRKERERVEINSEVTSEIISENAPQNVLPLTTLIPSKANTTFGPSVMERLLCGDLNPVATNTCTYCTQCSHGATAKPSSIPPVVNTANAKQEVSNIPNLQDDVQKPPVVENIVDTVVIKKEPGLETENSNSEIIEPPVFIDVNNLKIKQEPGLETETPPDQANDSMQLHNNHEQQIQIKKEPGTETESNLNADVPSVVMPAPEAEQQLPDLKQEHVMKQPNLNTEDASAVSNTPPEDSYLNSVISAEDGTAGFFRHVSTSNNNIVASEHQGVRVEKTQDQAISSSTAAEVLKVESASNVTDNARDVATPQQPDLSKHQHTSKEASINSEKSLVPRSQPPLKEEWIYEFHMVDVPYHVNIRRVAHYFRVPTSRIREITGCSSRPQRKHVVVSLSHYTTCQRVSNKKHLFGCRHSFIWSFKRYFSQDSR